MLIRYHRGEERVRSVVHVRQLMELKGIGHPIPDTAQLSWPKTPIRSRAHCQEWTTPLGWWG